MKVNNILCNTIQEKDSYNISGAYENKCGCNTRYISQMGCELKIWFREYILFYKYKRKDQIGIKTVRRREHSLKMKDCMKLQHHQNKSRQFILEKILIYKLKLKSKMSKLIISLTI